MGPAEQAAFAYARKLTFEPHKIGDAEVKMMKAREIYPVIATEMKRASKEVLALSLDDLRSTPSVDRDRERRHVRVAICETDDVADIGARDKTLRIYDHNDPAGRIHCSHDYWAHNVPYMLDWLAERL